MYIIDSGGSRGGARGALAPAEIWLFPEVPVLSLIGDLR